MKLSGIVCILSIGLLISSCGIFDSNSLNDLPEELQQTVTVAAANPQQEIPRSGTFTWISHSMKNFKDPRIDPLKLKALIQDAVQNSDLDEARRLQSLAVQMIDAIAQYPFNSAMKCVMAMLGFELGQCRSPQQTLSNDESAALRQQLDAIGIFDWQATATDT